MIYEFDSRIRYSEVNKEGELSLGGLINYFQDCSLFQSEHLGLGVAHLKEKHRAWLLSSWQVEIGKKPMFSEKVTIQTWSYGFKGFYGYRNFSMKGENGEILASAGTIWVYVDTESGHPFRIDEEELSGYGASEKLPMKYADRKIPFPEGAVQGEAFTVRRHQLDTNGHVNNGQYVQLAQDYLPEEFSVKRMRAEYKRQARLGDTMIPWISKEEDRYTIALCDEEKKPYALVVFEEK